MDYGPVTAGIVSHRMACPVGDAPAPWTRPGVKRGIVCPRLHVPRGEILSDHDRLLSICIEDEGTAEHLLRSKERRRLEPRVRVHVILPRILEDPRTAVPAK